ncbi:MlaD family protein [Roseinatronobacter sp.]|uniref:MlaD family protein n=1 Tax=Roseinatronobacter sp. TaxID=1945755 RepID=UPI0025E4F7CC|nr:MlaD family protein [Roseibaca sp.]
METKANYVLVGVFALLGFFGVLGFFLAFGKVQFDKQYAYYNVRFDSVAGLSPAADVTFAGLPVGRVVDIRLAPEQDGKVLVSLEVERETPVRADTVAVVDSSGITGVAYVALSPGSPDAPLINDREDVPDLTAGRSSLQSLTEGAPRILDEALQVVEQVNALLGEENRTRIENILINLESSSGEISRALDSFAGFTDTIEAATQTFAEFAGNLEPILLQAEKALESLQFAVDEGALVATNARIAFETGTQTLETVDSFVAQDLTEMVVQLRADATALRTELETASREATGMFSELSRTGQAATERMEALDPALALLEPLLERAETTLQSVEKMSDSVETLVSGEGSMLVSEAREMVSRATSAIDSVAQVAENDLPVIMSDIRAATAEVRGVVETVGNDLRNVSGNIDALSTSGLQALDQVTETFGNANTTLEAINRALETGEGALEAAERAFVGADRVINEDVAAITADLRDVLDRLGAAVDAVSADIPAVTADLRATAASAARTFDDLGAVVRDSAGPVRDFTAAGLPNITQLAREARGLIANLDGLARKLDSDPARLLLNSQTPEFRR